MGCSPPGPPVRGDSPGKETAARGRALPQGITQAGSVSSQVLCWLTRLLAPLPPGGQGMGLKVPPANHRVGFLEASPHA